MGVEPTKTPVGRRNSHDAHEWLQRNLDLPREERHQLSLALGDAIEMLADVRKQAGDRVRRRRRDVESGVAGSEARIPGAEHAAHRRGAVEAVRHARLEIEHLNLQHVAGLGAVHVDRPGEDVRAVLRPRSDGCSRSR